MLLLIIVIARSFSHSSLSNEVNFSLWQITVHMLQNLLSIRVDISIRLYVLQKVNPLLYFIFLEFV